jgi:ribosomal protein S18 acetylase RimI-like enzyme
VPEVALAVRPGARGRGVGTKLLETLIGRTRRQGRAALSLSVACENPALRLYERLGFVRVARVADAFTMRLDLAGA